MKKSIFALILTFCSIFCLQLFAQERGKPDFSDLKDVLKAAKDDDVSAMFKIAERCVGNIYDSDEVKDYKQAVKWLENALEKDANYEKGDSQLLLFKIYVTGGYGVEQDLAKAYAFLKEANIRRNNSIPLYFADNTNLNLSEFFVVKEKAEINDSQALINMARFYHAFNINLARAKEWLQKAENMQNLDAFYLKDKWSRGSNADSLLMLMKNHVVRGSNMAKMEYAFAEKDKKTLSAQEAKNLINDFIDEKNTDNELKIKALVILNDYLKNKEKITALRQLVHLVRRHAQSKPHEYFYEKAISELADFDVAAENLPALAQTLKKYPDITDIPFQIEQWNSGFLGNPHDLVSLHIALQSPENTSFLGSANIQRYENELKTKLHQVIDTADTRTKFIRLRKNFDTDPWLKIIKNEYTEDFKKKMLQYNMKEELMSFYYEKDILEYFAFHQLDEGKKYYHKINAMGLSIEQRDDMLKVLRAKVLGDLYGGKNDSTTFKSLKTAANREWWLLPDVQEKYMALAMAGREWFIGIQDRNQIRYLYTIAADPTSRIKNSYTLEIKGVKNEMMNVVYSGVVEFEDRTAKDSTIRAKIAFSAQQGGTYNWKIFPADYLEITFPANDENVTYKAVGRMNNVKDSQHDISPEQITRRAVAYENSPTNAMKTAVKILIIEFNKALNPL